MNSRNSRTIWGVLVHFLGIFFNIVPSLLIYFITDNKFTKENARNAAMWKLTFTVSILIAAGVTFVLMFISEYLAMLPAIFILILSVLDIVFCLYATYKSMNGEIWKYPNI